MAPRLFPARCSCFRSSSAAPPAGPTEPPPVSVVIVQSVSGLRAALAVDGGPRSEDKQMVGIFEMHEAVSESSGCWPGGRSAAGWRSASTPTPCRERPPMLIMVVERYQGTWFTQYWARSSRAAPACRAASSRFTASGSRAGRRSPRAGDPCFQPARQAPEAAWLTKLTISLPQH